MKKVIKIITFVVIAALLVGIGYLSVNIIYQSNLNSIEVEEKPKDTVNKYEELMSNFTSTDYKLGDALEITVMDADTGMSIFLSEEGKDEVELPFPENDTLNCIQYAYIWLYQNDYDYIKDSYTVYEYKVSDDVYDLKIGKYFFNYVKGYESYFLDSVSVHGEFTDSVKETLGADNITSMDGGFESWSEGDLDE